MALIRARSVLVLLLAACALLAAPVGATAEPPRAGSIAWREFDPKSFKEAQDQNKLVLLSIQAPWGHWDRMMSEITFADPNVAALVNESMVPIRVDALARPDVFARYGMGGWPTTAFLLPSGQPMYFSDAARKVIRAGGTYYATDPMRVYLQDLVKYYAANKDSVEKAAAEIARGVLSHKDVSTAPVKADMLEVAVTKMLEAQGTWNPDPNVKSYRAPDVDTAELAYTYWMKKSDRNVLDAALHRLTDMARGGIHDQLGGGFHRLASDAAWYVPAFEKMLGVNAEMIQAYAEAYMVTGGPRYRDIAMDTADYVLSTLRDPDGWFYAYQAADARLGEDGDYYTWTLDEAKAVLTEEEQKILLPAYDIGEWGEMVNSAPRRNVLHLSEGPQLLAERLKMERGKVEALFESGRRKMLEARSKRTAPAVGRVLLAETNAEVDAALIEAGDLLRKPELTQAGLKGLDFLLDKLAVPDTPLFDHLWSPDSGRAGMPAFFAEQVQVTRALLAAYESTGESRYLERAARIAAAADEAFADAVNGGWMDRLYVADAPGLLTWPARSIRDNALFAEALVRLRHLSGRAEDDPLVKSARKGLESWADEFARYRELSAPFGVAVERLLNPPVEVIVVGADAPLDALARSLYYPWRIVRHLPAGTAATALTSRQLSVPDGPACFFCLGSRCAGPYTKDDKPRAKLDQFLGIDRKAPPPASATKEGVR